LILADGPTTTSGGKVEAPTAFQAAEVVAAGQRLGIVPDHHPQQLLVGGIRGEQRWDAVELLRSPPRR